MSYITSTYYAGCIIVQIFVTALSSKLNYFYVLCIPLFVNAINMALIPTFLIVFDGEDTAFILLLILALLCGISTAFLNAGSFGLSAVFSPKHTEGLMIGEGIVGLISLIPFITHLASGEGHTNEVGLSFFIISSVINIVGVVSVLSLRCVNYSRRTLIKARLLLPDPESEEELLLLKPLNDEDNMEQTSEEPQENRKSNWVIFKGFWVDIWHVGKKKVWWGLAIFLNYFFTLVAYPTVVLNIPPPLDSLDKDDYSRSTWTVCPLSFTSSRFTSLFLLVYNSEHLYYL